MDPASYIYIFNILVRKFYYMRIHNFRDLQVITRRIFERSYLLCVGETSKKMWVAYKESSRINAFAWILLIICFGSMALCAYVVRELFYLSPEQPVFLILFNKSDKELMLTDPLLMENDNV
ncbi:uncharacterized protein LOC143605524 [Bidens hawaiensis]|uniref:uncharacterized protein LOC143605524 n=1 Tax=Bidens hawaiensis TaxID=980011 RepID=UPI00404B49DB